MIYLLGSQNWVHKYIVSKMKQHSPNTKIMDSPIRGDWNSLCSDNPANILFYDISKYKEDIERYRAIIQKHNLPTRIWGVWTGGSCNYSAEEDTYGWMKYYEMGVLAACDGIFVGSGYAKEVLTTRVLSHMSEGEEISKIIYSDGLPLDYEYLQSFPTQLDLQFGKDEKTIVIPYIQGRENSINTAISVVHALSSWTEFQKYEILFLDKVGGEDINEIDRRNLDNLNNIHPNVRVCRSLTREVYLQQMVGAQLVVSVAIDKNFDYEIAEALALGIPVLCPNHSCYPEMLDNNQSFLYNKVEDLLNLIPKIVSKDIDKLMLKNTVKPYDSVVETWIERMSG